MECPSCSYLGEKFTFLGADGEILVKCPKCATKWKLGESDDNN